MHALLKNESTEDEKYHNLMSWLVLLFSFQLYSKTSGRVKADIKIIDDKMRH